jgi:hypothetical protein
MTDALLDAVDALEETVSESTPHLACRPDRGGPVTYTIKVLSAAERGGKRLRTVSFQRTSAGESIEISAQTDATNLLAELPFLLEAALEIQRTLRPAQRAVSRSRAGFLPSVVEELRLVRWLTHGETAPARGRSFRALGPRGRRRR